ncbi:hypothetical protein F220043C3_07870 [Enterocloster asparagiformis]|uniref:sensor histidine kinase n=1 Tax=Enterocloster asparagiformis TaxID=333367 RepID=UPI0034BF7184
MNEIKQLHRRLTALYTVTTGLILTAVILGVLAVGTREFQKKNLENFQNTLLTITSRLQSGGTIDCTWLARMESAGKLIIHVEDNGRPLLYKGAWTPPTARQELIAQAIKKAEEEKVRIDMRPVSSSLSRTSIFTLNGPNQDAYFGSVLVIPTPKGYQSLTLLAWQNPADAGIYRQRFLFLFLDAVGIAALYLVCRVLVGRSLKPIEESRKKQNEFIAAASHELRSPLSVIRSSLSAVTAAPEKQDQFLANIDRECLRLSGLVSDLLLLASADAKTWTIRREDLDADTLLIGVYERFEPLARERNIRLCLELPEEALPHLTGDGQRLEQVLSILLDNALTYTPAGKQVTLSACRREARGHKKAGVTFAVSDQGCGVPDADKKHVFDRFYRADGSRTDRQHYGLGLSVAKELVQLHGGTIGLEDAEGGGARFLVHLPVKE